MFFFALRETSNELKSLCLGRGTCGNSISFTNHTCIRVFHKLDDIGNKNAFQWDAYRPLFTVRGGLCLRRSRSGGVSVKVESLSRWVSVQAGSLSGGGASVRETPLLTDRPL